MENNQTMKASELRIGNLIDFNISQNDRIVGLVTKGSITGIGIDHVFINEVKVPRIDMLRPISLTEEWLLRIPKDLLFPEWIKFVHELQNWYWVESKFKKELEIKES